MGILHHILIHRFRRTGLLWAFSLGIVCGAIAQNTSSQVHVYFQMDTIQAELGSTFTNLLVIDNRGAEPINLYNLSPLQSYPGLLFFPENEILVEGGEIRRLPVKFMANLDFMKSSYQRIQFSLMRSTPSSATAEEHELELSFAVSKPENRMLAITPFSRENYLPYGAEETTLTFFVENRSYRSRNIRLSIRSMPDGLNIAPRDQHVSLAGLEKQMIEIKISLRNPSIQFPEFQIEVRATDGLDDNEVGTTRFFVTALSYNRQVAPNPHVGGQSNFLELNYNHISSGFSYLQFRGNTEFAAPGNFYTRLNLQTDTYLEEGLYNVYDTWIELEKDHSQLRLGSVYGSDYDYSISGRGGQFSTRFQPHQQIEVMAVENNYNLFGNYYPHGNAAKMLGVKYDFGRTGEWGGKASYVFDHDDRLSVNSQVAHFTSSFAGGDRHQGRIHGGLSHEKGLVDDDKQVGGTLGFDYEFRSAVWDFQSHNAYSTRGYAGLNRGYFDISQRLGRELARNQRIFAQYQHSRINPRYLNFQSQPDYVRPEYLYSNIAIKTGYQWNTGNWNLLFSPQVVQQKTTFGDVNHELVAYRLHAQLGTAAHRHGFNLTAEYSYANKDNHPDWFHGLRTNLTYRFGQLSLHGTAQWNPYSVIELHAYQYEDQNFWNTQLYAAYDFGLWRNRLSGSAAVGMNYSELYRNINNNGRLHIEYKISPSWSATGYFNASDLRPLEFEGYKGYHYQVRAGVKKYFAVSTATGNHKVSFLVFADANFNGRYDAGEAVHPHEVVRLDDHVAITDERGRVTFLNVPKGSYTLHVQGRGGTNLHREPILVEQNIRMDIGVVETIRVTGRLSELRQKYDRRDTKVRGIVVYARTRDGQVHRTVVNHENQFEFYLESGEYEIYIDNEQYNFTNPVQSVVLGYDVEPETLVFTYRKKDTTIKVKTF